MQGLEGDKAYLEDYIVLNSKLSVIIIPLTGVSHSCWLKIQHCATKHYLRVLID